MTSGNKIHVTPADEALFKFDAENKVEPPRVIAQRVARRHGLGYNGSLIDDIAHALEDAMEIGQKRGKFL